LARKCLVVQGEFDNFVDAVSAASRSMPSPDEIRARLVAAFADFGQGLGDTTHVEVTDLTGTQDHLQALVVSPAFAGKTRIEQHQMVYAALGDLMNGPIHALALTPRAR
jgi:stress-induced morphogen